MIPTRPGILVCSFSLALCLPAATQQTALGIDDDFSAYEEGATGSPQWNPNSIWWEVRDGRYEFLGYAASMSLVADERLFGDVMFEATITLQEGHGKDWKVAGLTVHADAGNFWHLALVESPEDDGGRHFVELSEMKDGKWLSQQSLTPAVAGQGNEFPWEYGTPYRLRIELSPERITGTVREVEGDSVHRMGYDFTDAAVTRGRPGLRTSWLTGAFDDVALRASDPSDPPQAKGPPPLDVAADDAVIGEATGFCYVKQIDGVWWVVNPEGRRFYAIGTDHCRYTGHWCEKLGYAPYGRNMEAKFASPEAWAESATERLKDWHFNLLGAGGGAEAFYRGLAHTKFAAFGSTFSDVSDLCPKTTWTGFPNVFHPKWRAYCDTVAQGHCGGSRDDPWLFGYFLDNELEWYGKTHTQWGLFDETMKKPADHSGKIALVDFLRKHYENVEAFCEAWGREARSFDEVVGWDALDDRGDAQLRKVKIDFVRLVADRYFAVTTTAIRKHDPNHMVIGCRFAGSAPAGIWDIAGKYCDIVTFNYYGRVDLETDEAPGLAELFTGYYRQAQRPMMITEWSFPALDSGLPCKHGAGQRFDTQEQRAQAYEIFQKMVISLPFMVGSDYFMWVDEPALGISSTFPEDTNYGLVNEQDEPYPELTRTARRVNAMVYEIHQRGMADLAVGQIRASAGGLRVPIINRGHDDVAVDVALTVDGTRTVETVKVPARGRETLVQDHAFGPGGHVIAVQLDPDRRLSQVARDDDRAAKAFIRPGLDWPAFAGKGTVRIPLVVANPDTHAVTDMPVTVRLGKLSGLDWADVDASQVYVFDEGGAGLVDAQIDPNREALSPDGELCFVVTSLNAGECQTYSVLVQPVRQERRRPASELAFERLDGGYTLRARYDDPSPLELRKTRDSGDLIDEILVDGVLLGRYNPLVWQFPGQDQWAPANRFESAQASVGPVRTVLTLTAVREQDAGQLITAVDDEGEQETRAGVPVPFSVTHQVIVYPGRREFQARFVSVENTGDRPLQVQGYFFYLNAAIGGDPEGDAPATPDVPNYYAGGRGAWRDADVGVVFGAEAQPDSDLSVNFWLDEGGGQHPDARRTLDPPVILQPGETYAEPDAPLLTVYGAKDQGAPWREVQTRLADWGQAQVSIGKPERR